MRSRKQNPNRQVTEANVKRLLREKYRGIRKQYRSRGILKSDVAMLIEAGMELEKELARCNHDGDCELHEQRVRSSGACL